jgi:hypothetical protein
MSALQKILDCNDLIKLIIEYIPPHPVAIIIKDEFNNSMKNMYIDIDPLLYIDEEPSTLKEIFHFNEDRIYHTKIVAVIRFDNWLKHINSSIKKREVFFNSPYQYYIQELYDEAIKLYNSFSKIIIDDYRIINEMPYESDDDIY